MTISWEKSVCRLPTAINNIDANQYISNNSDIGESPIDEFYRDISRIIIAGKDNYINDNPITGGLFLIGIISATENYIRNIYAEIATYCIITQQKSAEKNVSLSTVFWFNGNNAARGALEGKSFASTKELKKFFAEYMGEKIEDLIDEDVLDQFEKLCHLRHNIVHSSSNIAAKNAIQLALVNNNTPLRININKSQVHDAANLCTSLVISINLGLFKSISRKWAIKWPNQENWEDKNRHSLFKKIWRTFYSTKDDNDGNIEHKLTIIKCRNQILKTYDN